MGVCFYLIREDNRTCFDLGKVGYWRDTFGEDPMIVDDAGTLADLIYLTECERADSLNRFAQALPREDPRRHEPMPRDYLLEVATRIVTWSEGQPFVFVSEHDSRYETIAMEGYDRGARRRDWVTGTRFREAP